MIKKLGQDNQLILKNLSFLTVLRFVNIATKFFLVAYLVRILGKVNYGILAWTDSIIQYFIIVINFGFNIYAAKYVVESKDSKEKLNETISAIYTIKFVLFLGSFLMLYGLTFLSTFDQYSNFLFLMLLMGFGEVFFPIWFFQGKEKLKLATYITVTARILLLLLTIYLIQTENDIYTYIYILVFSNFLMGALGYIVLKRLFDFKHKWLSYTKLLGYVKEAYMFFLGLSMSLAFNFLTVFLIGVYYTMDFVTGFDVALKCVLVFVIPFDMLQQAVFPTITRNRNTTSLKRIILISFVVGCIFTAMVFFFSKELLLLFGGNELMSFTNVLKILSPIPALTALSLMLGTCTLVAFGYQKEFNRSLIFASLFFLMMIAILYVNNELTFLNLVWLRVVSDLVLLLIRSYFVYTKKILRNESNFLH